MKKILLTLSVFAGLGAFAQAPVNDACTGAIALTMGETCVEVQGTVLGATDDELSGEDPYNAVFYKFVATDSRVAVNVYHETLDLMVDIFSGSCGALVPIYGIDSYESGLESDIVDGLTVGATYYISVRDYYGNNTETSAFDICLMEVVAPANDECVDAINLTVAPSAPVSNDDFVYGDLFTSSLSAEETECEFIENGHRGDLWYSFTPATSSVVVYVIQERLLDAQLDLYTGNCGDLTYMECIDNAFSNPATETASQDEGAIVTVVPGQTYYLRVKDYFRHYFGSQFGITVFNDPTAAISKVDVNGLNVYPNPATEAFTVKANTEIASVVVTNAVGQVVATMNQVSGNEIRINTDELANGLYNVTVVTAQGQSSKLINVAK